MKRLEKNVSLQFQFFLHEFKDKIQVDGRRIVEKNREIRSTTGPKESDRTKKAVKEETRIKKR